MKQPSRLRRVRPLRWRDLRLWLGLTCVVVAMFLGASLLSADDDRVLVWRAVTDMAEGATPTQIEPVLVSLGEVHEAYVRADEQPSGVLQHPLSAGQLLPRAALTTEIERVHEVTVGVESAHAPIAVQPGHLVDVWVTSQEGASTLVHPDARVVHVVDDAMRGGLHVVLAVPPTQTARIIAAVRSGSVDLVSVPVAGDRT